MIMGFRRYNAAISLSADNTHSFSTWVLSCESLGDIHKR